MSWTSLITKNLRELRFILCQTNDRSSGMRFCALIFIIFPEISFAFRNFITNNYLKLKEKNPEFPFIVRECEGADPYVIARYSN